MVSIEIKKFLVDCEEKKMKTKPPNKRVNEK
jgi:hypothetical protein